MKIIIVDDDPVARLSLQTIVEADGEVEVVGTGADGEEAVVLYGAHKPDIVLMDIRMGGVDGIEAARRILLEDSGAKIIFLTTFADDEYIVAALKMGAKGYILKQDFDRILPALKAVAAGQSVLGSDVLTKIPSLIEKSEQPDLTSCGIEPKEQQIISLIAEGLSNREIAERVFLSEGTVRNYISAILEKLNLRDRTQIAVFYYKSR